MPIKLTLDELVSAYTALNRLAQFPLGEKARYNVAKFMNKLKAYYNSYDSQRKIFVNQLTFTEFNIVKTTGSNQIITDGICRHIKSGDMIRIFDANKNNGRFEVRSVTVDEESKMYMLIVVPGNLKESTEKCGKFRHQYFETDKEGKKMFAVNPLNFEIFDEKIEEMKKQEIEIDIRPVKRSELIEIEKLPPMIISELGQLFEDDIEEITK